MPVSYHGDIVRALSALKGPVYGNIRRRLEDQLKPSATQIPRLIKFLKCTIPCQQRLR